MDRRHFLALLAGAAPGGAALAGSAGPAWSRERALDFLVRRQSADGAWRSDVYGMFRGGQALTPLVLRALHRDRGEAAAAGLAWVARQPRESWTLFPVHNASWLLELAAAHEEVAPLRDPLVDALRGLQLSPSRNWPHTHRFCGGWSYAAESPRFREDLEIPAMQQPNLSATVLAVAGLRAAGLAVDDPTLQQAGGFIRGCQNYGDGERRFDDGGFFQMHDDLARNKGGKKGVDSTGRLRFASYTAATADGLAGLLLTGAPPDDPRVRSACRWLVASAGSVDVPDLRYYAAYSRQRAARLLEVPFLAAPASHFHQHRDGSCRNAHGEMRENDPLVATALAVLATDGGGAS